MVTSLSTDKAVWEAMLNNEVVKGIRESLTKGQYYKVFFRFDLMM